MPTRSGHARSARSTSGSYSPDAPADLYRVLREAWGIDSFAAGNMFARGQVSIDGHTIPAPWARGHWKQRQLVGRMLKTMRGEVRLYGGGRHIAQYDQMRLGA